MNKLRVRKVYMLANGHPVFDTRIFVKEARSLEASGFEVSLIIPAASDDQRGSIRIIAIPPVRKGWQALLLNPWRILKKALLQPSDAVFVIHDSDILIAGIALKLARSDRGYQPNQHLLLVLPIVL